MEIKDEGIALYKVYAVQAESVQYRLRDGEQRVNVGLHSSV